MKQLLFALLFIPLLTLSQTRTSVSFMMESKRSVLQFPLADYNNEGEVFYFDSRQSQRVTGAYFEIEQLISNFPGAYGVTLKLNYQIVDERYIGSHPEYGDFDFTELRNILVPCLGFRYYLLNIDGLKISANMGGHLQIEEIYLSLNDTDIEFNNSISPYLGAQADISLFDGLLSLVPYINYQMEPIVFEEISDIDAVAIDEALNGPFTGWVSGLQLSFNINF